ncbi:GGDEF domain-containing protein [Halomicronema hongdechloris]
MPHGSCFFWDPWLTALHVVADAGVALAYFSIPLLLFLYRDRAAATTQPLLLLFAAFILSCGLGHGFRIWNIWHAHYWLEGSWMMVTAMISLYTAWELKQVMPLLLSTQKDLLDTQQLLEKDDLTGVANRRGLETAFQRLVLQSVEPELDHALLLLDLDDFKQVNDTYGHGVGDLLLRLVAEKLCDRTRSLDTVVRLGGDEFAILLAGCSLAGANLIAQDIRRAMTSIRLPMQEQEPSQRFQVTASIGIAPIQPVMPLGQCYDQADQALYQAKRRGKNQIAIVSCQTQAPQVQGL